MNLVTDHGPLLTIGILLLVLGLIGLASGLGFQIGRRRAARRKGISEPERARMVRLLHELGSWTSEYSGNVSQYQSRLGELSAAVRESKASQNDGGERMVVLLQQIMQSNEQLQARLDAAEKQLDQQTQQIECYLNEARTDGLTGLLNRRSWDQRIEELFSAYRKGGRSFVAALIDIDHFKAINDNHGHQAGDEVLQQLASILSRELQDALIVARFGGEEFGVILEGPLRIAAVKLDELRKRIARQPFQVGPLQLDITISVGLSEPRSELVPGPVVRRADESLYAAKNIGRNRVYYHDGRGPCLVGAPEIAR